MDFIIDKLKIFMLCGLFLSVSMVSHVKAQEGGGGGDFLGDSLSDVYLVAGAGLAGAILGLSTLSFVEEPKDHTKNIMIGGAVGIIIGVGVVAYRQATKNSKSFNEEQAAYLPRKQDDFIDPTFSASEFSKKSSSDKDLLGMNFQFEF